MREETVIVIVESLLDWGGEPYRTSTW